MQHNNIGLKVIRQLVFLNFELFNTLLNKRSRSLLFGFNALNFKSWLNILASRLLHLELFSILADNNLSRILQNHHLYLKIQLSKQPGELVIKANFHD